MSISNFEKMGIQQWRLRKPELLSPSAAEIGLEPAVEVHGAEREGLPPELPLAASEPLLEQTSQDDPLDWLGLAQLISPDTPASAQCQSCSEQNSLLGSGSKIADWLFISDAPSSREVAAGAFFDGRAGQLFEAMLQALSLDRDGVYCTSIFKCAPTDDLSSSPQCGEWVHQQIALLKPKVVITFGEFTAQALLKSNESLVQLREGTHVCLRSDVTVIPTYSPREMLEEPHLKAQVWADLKKAIQL